MQAKFVYQKWNVKKIVAYFTSSGGDHFSCYWCKDKQSVLDPVLDFCTLGLPNLLDLWKQVFWENKQKF